MTPEMLRWLYTHLHGGTLEQAEAAFNGGPSVSRFSSCSVPPSTSTLGTTPATRARGRDLRLTREGKPCSHRDFEDADELTVFIRGSKTDVYNRGEYRNHYKTGLLLCPVRAAVQLFKAFPLRFAGGARRRGTPLQRR